MSGRRSDFRNPKLFKQPNGRHWPTRPSYEALRLAALLVEEQRRQQDEAQP